ncbi:hypothetical protein EDD36DRAFT_325617 [Exophiala viscosa]|uniref:Uncharacterized protein n=1 Tax=Exophiala viscosa TaxID=2486360 RepID=A0AAN6DPX8_9EURO|nr:hypothetical protein EDD36DRAFT_325617 [Exophiala viscosa]
MVYFWYAFGNQSCRRCKTKRLEPGLYTIDQHASASGQSILGNQGIRGCITTHSRDVRHVFGGTLHHTGVVFCIGHRTTSNSINLVRESLVESWSTCSFASQWRNAKRQWTERFRSLPFDGPESQGSLCRRSGRYRISYWDQPQSFPNPSDRRSTPCMLLPTHFICGDDGVMRRAVASQLATQPANILEDGAYAYAYWKLRRCR